LTNDQFTIRPAGADDADAIAHFVMAMALETEGEELDPAQVRQAVRTALDDRERAPYFLAVPAEDESAGPVGGLMFTTEWSDWNNAYYWWMQSLYVRPEWRGRGAFRALYDHLEQLAREAGDVCALRLYVFDANTGAQAAYERLGMSRRPFLVYERRLDE